MKALLDEEARALLSASRIGRLGCIDNGEPYVVPIVYVFEGRINLQPFIAKSKD
jgi:nitroimidazol reductase NimA-like FMN-containing flavoprotein (pyridoxamine 5'-phosphate oxidase superfamily)